MQIHDEPRLWVIQEDSTAACLVDTLSELNTPCPTCNKQAKGDIHRRFHVKPSLVPMCNKNWSRQRWANQMLILAPQAAKE